MQLISFFVTHSLSPGGDSDTAQKVTGREQQKVANNFHYVIIVHEGRETTMCNAKPILVEVKQVSNVFCFCREKTAMYRSVYSWHVW